MPDAVPSSRTTVLQAIADVIGNELAEALSQALGGTRIYVPTSCGNDHVITKAVGVEAAALICEFFHSTLLLLPTPDRARRVLEMRAVNMTVREIALAVGIADAQVRAILAHSNKFSAMSR